MFLDRGADIHADNDLALIWASQNGHAETVRLLLNRGANVDANDNMALKLAYNDATREILLEYGARNPNDG